MQGEFRLAKLDVCRNQAQTAESAVTSNNLVKGLDVMKAVDGFENVLHCYN